MEETLLLTGAAVAFVNSLRAFGRRGDGFDGWGKGYVGDVLS